jgi:uncharacterized protein
MTEDTSSRMGDKPSLNVSKILRHGGDVSSGGELSGLTLTTFHPDGSSDSGAIPIEGTVQWRAVISHVGTDEYWLAGRVQASAILECARCLAPVIKPIEARLEGLMRYKSSVTTPRRIIEDDGEEIIVFGDPSIDLSALLAEAFTLETPEIVLHSPDCKGLCVECGANLNHLASGTCAVASPSCPQLVTKKLEVENPFAGLKDLFKE